VFGKLMGIWLELVEVHDLNPPLALVIGSENKSKE